MGTTEAASQYDTYILSYAPPGEQKRAVGVFVYDRSANVLHWRLPDSWNFVEDEFDREYLALLSADIKKNVADIGAGRWLNHLLGTLSNVLRLSEPCTVAAPDGDFAAAEAYRRWVHA